MPSWSKDPKTSYSTINARAETVTTKPTFRAAFKSRHCLVPADGFYEWQKAGVRRTGDLEIFKAFWPLYRYQPLYPY